jgi:hypothetical protein
MDSLPPNPKTIESLYVAVAGSVLSGFKFWGPFDSVDEAVEWAESRKPLIGFVSVVPVQSPESF